MRCLHVALLSGSSEAASSCFLYHNWHQITSDGLILELEQSLGLTSWKPRDLECWVDDGEYSDDIILYFVMDKYNILTITILLFICSLYKYVLAVLINIGFLQASLDVRQSVNTSPCWFNYHPNSTIRILLVVTILLVRVQNPIKKHCKP